MKLSPITSFLFVFMYFLCGCSAPSSENPPNILLICIDDLRPELKSFGVDYISSPNIDQFANESVAFQRHYVNAPSCGPSRFTLLTGLYGPAGNDALFQRAKSISEGITEIHPSMPEWFRSHGYTTVSVGKVSHHPGGWGGPDWNDTSIIEMPGAWDKHLLPVGEWETPRGIMHGLANGEKRVKASDMAVFQSVEGPDEIYPDGIITEEAVKQLTELSRRKDQPFFLAVGIIKPHLPFGSPEKYIENYKELTLPPIPHPEKPEGRTTWHPSGEFMQYNLWDKDPYSDLEFQDQLRKHYASCVSYADAQVGKILQQLKDSGQDENTIVILWGDHGWHLGEHAIWGKHSLFEESLRSPLIVHYPGMKSAGISTNAIVETLDIFPTLCDLTGIEKPSFTQGVSLRSLLESQEADGHAAAAYIGNAKTIRTDDYRLTLHKDGYVELYDEKSKERENNNVAESKPEIVAELKTLLEKKLQQTKFSQ